MSKEKPPGRQVLDRRTLLRSGAAAAFAAPLGVFGAQALPFRAASRVFRCSSIPARLVQTEEPKPKAAEIVPRLERFTPVRWQGAAG